MGEIHLSDRVLSRKLDELETMSNAFEDAAAKIRATYSVNTLKSIKEFQESVKKLQLSTKEYAQLAKSNYLKIQGSIDEMKNADSKLFSPNGSNSNP